MTAHRRLPALDSLRAFAILWVIGLHLSFHFDVERISPLLGRFLRCGGAGVDLFFVLSGYLIAGLVRSELRATGRLDVRRFWRRRWMRTLPAYYVTLAVIAGSDWVVRVERGWRGF